MIKHHTLNEKYELEFGQFKQIIGNLESKLEQSNQDSVQLKKLQDRLIQMEELVKKEQNKIFEINTLRSQTDSNLKLLENQNHQLANDLDQKDKQTNLMKNKIIKLNNLLIGKQKELELVQVNLYFEKNNIYKLCIYIYIPKFVV